MFDIIFVLYNFKVNLSLDLNWNYLYWIKILNYTHTCSENRRLTRIKLTTFVSNNYTCEIQWSHLFVLLGNSFILESSFYI